MKSARTEAKEFTMPMHDMSNISQVPPEFSDRPHLSQIIDSNVGPVKVSNEYQTDGDDRRTGPYDTADNHTTQSMP